MTYKEMCCEWLALFTGFTYEHWLCQDDAFIIMNFEKYLEEQGL